LEEAKGELQQAIDLYQQVLRQYPENRKVGAEAQLHIGICKEKLGLKEAQEAYQKVISKYPEQTEAVEKAKEKLSLLVKVRNFMEKRDTEFKITKIYSSDSTILSFISPDGEKLAIVKEGDIWLRELATGKEKRLSETPSFEFWCWWSPDSRMIAMIDVPWKISVVSVDGGIPNILVKSQIGKTSQDAIYPIGWTADSNILIYYSQSKNAIFGIPPSGGEWKEIYKLSRTDIFPDGISPDGKLIAFTLDNDIYVKSLEYEKPIQITTHPASDRLPVWSHDGKCIAFLSSRRGEEGIWAVKIAPDGGPSSEPIFVVKRLSPMNFDFNWTLDGKLGVTANPMCSNIFIADVQSGKETQLTNIFALETRPIWSPDGTKLAFISERGGKKNIWVMPSAGGEAKLITGITFVNSDILFIDTPVWSPDGKTIAFSAPSGPEESRGIWMAPAEGGKATRIECDFEKTIWEIDWSPDGENIAFNSGEGDIYVLPLKSREPINLTKKNREELRFYNPRWSPDGKKLVFQSGDQGIGIIDAEGGESQLLLGKVKGLRKGFSWSPDGEYIYFSQWEKKMKLCRISTKDGKIQKLGIDGYHPDISPDGSRMVFTRWIKSINEYWLVDNFLPK
jgi:Tol biopolymer transport system component